MKLTRLFALVALALLPLATHAEGYLQKGDVSHPIPVQDQTTAGVLVNGDTLVMHIENGLTGTSVTGTGTFSQPDTANQPGIYAYTLSSADAAAEVYGFTLFQASDSTTPANIVNPYSVEIVAFNPFDAAFLGLSGVSATNKALVLATGIVGASPTTTTIPTNLPTVEGDIYSGDEVTWLTGANAGKVAHVLSYSTTGSTLTLTAALPNAPSAGDTFSLSPFGKALTLFGSTLDTTGKPVLSPNDTQAQTEDTAALTAYGPQKAGVAVTIGTLPNVTVGGYATGQDPATLVWNALTTNYTLTGSFGQYVQNIGGGGGGGSLTAAQVWTYPTRQLTTLSTSPVATGAPTPAQVQATLAGQGTQTVTIPAGRNGLSAGQTVPIQFDGVTYTLTVGTQATVPQTVYEILHNGGYVP